MTILALILVAVAMALPLAHALEMPGKLRLDPVSYGTVQSIYYPGFLVAGAISELGGLIVLAILVYQTSLQSEEAWLLLASFLLLLASHAVYWVFVYPVNRIWLKEVAQSSPRAAFLAAISHTPEMHWPETRDVWEWAQVARAVLAALSFVALVFVFHR